MAHCDIDEPRDTLAALVRDHGAGAVTHALARVLREHRRQLRLEGELESGKHVGQLARKLFEQSDALRAEGL